MGPVAHAVPDVGAGSSEAHGPSLLFTSPVHEPLLQVPLLEVPLSPTSPVEEGEVQNVNTGMAGQHAMGQEVQEEVGPMSPTVPVHDGNLSSDFSSWG